MTVPAKVKEIHPKVAASGVAGAVTILLVYVAALVGLDVPAEVASAFTVVVSAAAGYMKRG